jgi:hypothetical protein
MEGRKGRDESANGGLRIPVPRPLCGDLAGPDAKPCGNASAAKSLRAYPINRRRAMAKYRKGEWVEWNWGAGTGTGKVSDTFTEKVTRTIEGSEITRNADADNPAYMIEQEDGSRVLKSESELSKPD